MTSPMAPIATADRGPGAGYGTGVLRLAVCEPLKRWASESSTRQR